MPPVKIENMFSEAHNFQLCKKHFVSIIEQDIQDELDLILQAHILSE